jgi:hypothetical protein
MKTLKPAEARELFRIWLAEYAGRRPQHWFDVPRQARALERADERCLSAAAAREFLEGFNRVRRNDRLWAVAVPVVVRIDGEPRRGRPIRRIKNPSRVCQKSTLDGLIPRDSF